MAQAPSPQPSPRRLRRAALLLAACLLAVPAVAQVVPAPAPAIPAAPVAPATPALPTPAPITPAPADQPVVPHDLSPMGMYRQADSVVKAVMLALLAASFLCWTVWLSKTAQIWAARRALARSHAAIHRADTVAEAARALNRHGDPAALMARAVAEELERSAALPAGTGPAGAKERAASLVERIEGQALARLRRGTGIVANTGSVAPFVGLFGTVWGIMNAFIGISESKTTNLAVVAPGIAEALFATALGLVAAIPAVVIYNLLSRANAGYRLALGDAGAAVLRLASRDLDRRADPAPAGG